jgi:hypothetical protein
MAAINYELLGCGSGFQPRIVLALISKSRLEAAPTPNKSYIADPIILQPKQ